jgi:hypothetical protein
VLTGTKVHEPDVSLRQLGNRAVEMTHPSKKLTLESEFDAFLFAPIGEEKNGMPLSVLSALARLDIDPWQEAAELVRMPRTAANRRVTSLIAGLDFSSAAPVETIAARLIGLLPAGIHSSPVSSKSPHFEGAVLSRRALVCVVLLNVLLAVATMGAHWATASQSPPAKFEIPDTSTASEPSPWFSSPLSGE